MRLPRIFPSRLVAQIYLFGVATILAVGVLAFAGAAIHFRGPPPPMRQIAQIVIERVAQEAPIRGLEDAVHWAGEEFDVDLVLETYDGTVIASSRGDYPRQRLRQDEISEMLTYGEVRLPGPPTVAIPVPAGAASMGDYAVVTLQPPFLPRESGPFIQLGIALLVLALTSFLFARWLAKPLKTLSAAVAAFGDGDLTARARLRRSDELGALGNRFDNMADSISALVKAQKELVANVSHELRTPISRIRVALDIAELGDANAAAAHGYGHPDAQRDANAGVFAYTNLAAHGYTAGGRALRGDWGGGGV